MSALLYPTGENNVALQLGMMVLEWIRLKTTSDYWCNCPLARNVHGVGYVRKCFIFFRLPRRLCAMSVELYLAVGCRQSVLRRQYSVAAQIKKNDVTTLLRQNKLDCVSILLKVNPKFTKKDKNWRRRALYCDCKFIKAFSTTVVQYTRAKIVCAWRCVDNHLYVELYLRTLVSTV